MDNIPDKTLEAAVTAAADMHVGTHVSQLAKINLGIYPNPTVDYAKISFYLPKSENVTLEVFSVTGQLVYSQDNIYMSAGSQHFNWDATNNSGGNVQSGVYYVKVKAGNANSMEKLIIAN